MEYSKHYYSKATVNFSVSRDLYYEATMTLGVRLSRINQTILHRVTHMHGRNDRKVPLRLAPSRCHRPDLAASLQRQVSSRALEDNIAVVHNSEITTCLSDIFDDMRGE